MFKSIPISAILIKEKKCYDSWNSEIVHFFTLGFGSRCQNELCHYSLNWLRTLSAKRVTNRSEERKRLSNAFIVIAVQALNITYQLQSGWNLRFHLMWWCTVPVMELYNSFEMHNCHFTPLCLVYYSSFKAVALLAISCERQNALWVWVFSNP